MSIAAAILFFGVLTERAVNNVSGNGRFDDAV